MKILKPRPEVEKLKPYRPPGVSARTLLAANESPFNLPSVIRREIKEKLAEISFNRYPDPLALELREEIASCYNLVLENVAVGSGSDELVLHLLLAYGGSGRTLITFEPTFSMYATVGQVTQTAVKTIPRTDLFEIDKEVLEQAVRTNPQIVFVCSPNNPTGNLTGEGIIRELLKETDGLVVVDEAYAEFSGQSVCLLLEEYPNLVVLRTFSKAFSIASLRVGYLLASSEVVSDIFKVKLPYNYNSPSQAAATLIFKKQALFLPYIERIIKERERLLRELEKIPRVYPFPSSANFILFRTKKEASQVWQGLLDQGVLIKDFEGEPLLKNYLRVTVGSEEENNCFLKALGEVA